MIMMSLKIMNLKKMSLKMTVKISTIIPMETITMVLMPRETNIMVTKAPTMKSIK